MSDVSVVPQGRWQHCSAKRHWFHLECAIQSALGAVATAPQTAALDWSSRSGRSLL